MRSFLAVRNKALLIGCLSISNYYHLSSFPACVHNSSIRSFSCFYLLVNSTDAARFLILTGPRSIFAIFGIFQNYLGNLPLKYFCYIMRTFVKKYFWSFLKKISKFIFSLKKCLLKREQERESREQCHIEVQVALNKVVSLQNTQGHIRRGTLASGLLENTLGLFGRGALASELYQHAMGHI